MNMNDAAACLLPGDDVDELIFEGEDYHESER